MGKLSVISGIRLTWTGLADAETGARAAPQTVQRAAFALKRVPQVGQIFVFAGLSVIFFSTCCREQSLKKKLYHIQKEVLFVFGSISPG